MLANSYTPNPDHVRIMDERPVSEFLPPTVPWHIELSAECTVVELCLLMTRYGCHAMIITAEVLHLVPREPGLPCPTAAGVAELFQFGLAALRDGRFEPIQLQHRMIR